MSQAQLALLASPETQAAIRALGGAVPDLSTAAAQAQAETLKQLVESGKQSAVAVLQSFTAYTSGLVTEENGLRAKLAEVEKKKAAATKVNAFYASTNNIFPMQKLIGVPTSKDVLAQFPDIDKIPDNWVAPGAAPAVASSAS